MTEPGSRTGAARDVPPPRPVRTSGVEPEETTALARAARAVADAVGGLLGAAPGPVVPEGPDAPSARAGLKNVVGALAAAAVAWRGRRDEAAGPATAPADGGSRSPGVFLSDLLSTAAPRLPIRDRARLHADYPGATDEEIAEALVVRYGRLTAAVGAATGGVAAGPGVAAPAPAAPP